MEEKKIRIIFHRGSLWLKLAVLAMLVLSIMVLLMFWLKKQDAESFEAFYELFLQELYFCLP